MREKCEEQMFSCAQVHLLSEGPIGASAARRAKISNAKRATRQHQLSPLLLEHPTILRPDILPQGREDNSKYTYHIWGFHILINQYIYLFIFLSFFLSFYLSIYIYICAHIIMFLFIFVLFCPYVLFCCVSLFSWPFARQFPWPIALRRWISPHPWRTTEQSRRLQRPSDATETETATDTRNKSKQTTHTQLHVTARNVTHKKWFVFVARLLRVCDYWSANPNPPRS